MLVFALVFKSMIWFILSLEASPFDDALGDAALPRVAAFRGLAVALRGLVVLRVADALRAVVVDLRAVRVFLRAMVKVEGSLAQLFARNALTHSNFNYRNVAYSRA